MSDSSRKDSKGSQKSFMGRINLGKRTGSDAASTIKKSFNHVSDITKNVGNSIQSVIGSTKKDTSVFSRGVRELDVFGFERYNISEESEIFISKVPEKAMFNDGEPIIEHATAGKFVGPEAPKVAHIQMDPAPASEPSRSPKDLFTNVVLGDKETVVTGTVGVATENGVEVTAPSRAVPDNSFLSKMSPRQSVPTDVGIPNESDGISMAAEPEDHTVSEYLDNDTEIMIVESVPVAETVPDVAGDAVGGADEVSAMPVAPVAKEEFFFEDVLDDVPIEDAPAEGDTEDDIDWMMYGDDSSADPQTFEQDAPESDEAVSTDIVSMGPSSALEMDTVEPAMEQVAPAMEATTEEAPAPAEAPLPVVEEQMMVTPVLSSITDTGGEEGIEGLHIQGNIPSADAVGTDEIATPVVSEVAVTSGGAGAVQEPIMRIKGLDEEGADILPAMSDPVVRRPRGVRFRFNNGVLQSVEEPTPAKDEPKEELRVPFDVTVEEAVIQEEVPAEYASESPVMNIEDEVADIMRLTVPELFPDDGQDQTVPDAQLVCDDDFVFVSYMIRAEARVAAEHAAESYLAAIPKSQGAPSHRVAFTFGQGGDASGSKVCFSF